MIIDLDTHIDLVETISCEVIVVGGGTSGLLLASQLGTKGANVCVVESGSYTVNQNSESLNDVINLGREYNGTKSGRLRVLGGTSKIWGGAFIPFLKSDLSDRPYVNLKKWPIDWEEIYEEIPELERIFSLSSGSYESAHLSESRLKADGIIDDEMFVNRFAKWPKFSKRNVFKLFKDDLIKSKNVTVIVNATVVELLKPHYSCETLSGLKIKNTHFQEKDITADKIVLASGAIESTRILLNYKNSLSNKTIDRSGYLGVGFNDHVSVQLGEVCNLNHEAINKLVGFRFQAGMMRSHRWELTPKQQKDLSSPSAWVHLSFEQKEQSAFHSLRLIMQSVQTGKLPSLSNILNLFKEIPYLTRLILWRFFRSQLLAPLNATFRINIVLEQLPKSSNFLRLARERDCYGTPKLELFWDIDDFDANSIMKVAKLFEQYWDKNLESILGKIHWYQDIKQSLDLNMIKSTDIFHPASTTRMAEDESKGIVDTNLCVFGTKNLFVLSTSVFPCGGSANPTMTLLLLALRLANHLKSKELAD